MKLVSTMRWERLDVPGIDECRLLQADIGWRLEGHAEFTEGGQDHKIDYAVDCTANWNTWRATIEGTANHVIERKSGHWFLNGVEQEIGAGIGQVDFGFTPATNYLQLKQMNLAVGQSDDCVVAWFDLNEPELVYLHQLYNRTGEHAYEYDSPSYGYSETLIIGENGFVADYPGLWKSE